MTGKMLKHFGCSNFSGEKEKCVLKKVHEAHKKTWFEPDGFPVSGNCYDQGSTILRHLKDDFCFKHKEIM